MYSSGIALPKSPRRKGDYAITSVIPYRFSGGNTGVDDPNTIEAFRTAMATFGLTVSEKRLAETRGTSFSDMTKSVMSSGKAGSGAELVIFAHSTPDLIPSDIPAADLLALQRPTALAAFALCDEGPLIAFTAIEIARQFAARQAYERIFILLAEHATFPYEPPTTNAQLVSGDAAVLLILERSDSRITMIERRFVAPEADASQIESALVDIIEVVQARHPAGDRGAVWTLGFSLLAFAPAARALIDGQVFVSASGQPVTSVWRDSITSVSPDEPATAVVIDFDTTVGAIAACRFILMAGAQQ